MGRTLYHLLPPMGFKISKAIPGHDTNMVRDNINAGCGE